MHRHLKDGVSTIHILSPLFPTCILGLTAVRSVARSSRETVYDIVIRTSSCPFFARYGGNTHTKQCVGQFVNIWQPAIEPCEQRSNKIIFYRQR